ncbi:MAG: class I SAM-dependent methyltransferase family protein [Candidatus Aenigmarchaeota archaeon]|nr:class I SAM-dependent methyltransferase family protein [Candidatus Aenigmarchaeota archaeon]
MRPIAKMLQGELTAEELELVPRSYDIIGSEEKAAIVIEIPKELDNKKKIIAEALMQVNKHVKSVLNKLSGRKGTYRLEQLELIAGEKNTEVLHKEHGYMLKLDPSKVFFSPREATERQRIASLVKPGENVLVMFSGVCPYAIAICKKQPMVNKVYAIEINPDAHKYAQENVRINRLSHKIVLINGDVKEVSSSLKMKFDRIVMPIAVSGDNFLDCAFQLLKDSGMIHFYFTGKGDDIFKDAENIVKSVAKNNKKKIEIENKIKVLPFATRSYKICLDVKAGVG